MRLIELRRDRARLAVAAQLAPHQLGVSLSSIGAGLACGASKEKDKMLDVRCSLQN